MGWKTWPRWLKGGIIALLIWFISFIIVYIYLYLLKGDIRISRLSNSSFLMTTWILIIFFSIMPMMLLGFGAEAGIDIIIIFILLYLCFLFFIGSLTGLIIGKIKSKRGGK